MIDDALMYLLESDQVLFAGFVVTLCAALTFAVINFWRGAK